MGFNILSAMDNIANFKNNSLKDYSTKYLIRINAIGDQLEYYVKDAIANCFRIKIDEKDAVYSKCFSWLGNQNNPPDAIIREGDAFEVKKVSPSRLTHGLKGTLALNSSPPKNMLYKSDPRVIKKCKNCEEWTKKDIYYTVGYVIKKTLKHLIFVQGLCYAADKEIYENVHVPLKKEIDNIISQKGLESSDTVELGKVKKVDPLGITELRIRGMWSIQSPMYVFQNVYTYDPSKDFCAVAIMKKDKYESYPKVDREKVEKNKLISVNNAKIKDPNNPAKLLEVKVIVVEY